MKNIKTTWNLSLLYKSEKDPQIEKDLKSIEKVCEQFEKKYKGKDFTSGAKKLLPALKDYKKLVEVMNGHKPWWYFSLKRDLNSKDEIASAKATQHSERITKAGNKITFFQLEIGRIPRSKQSGFLKEKSLSEYRYLLKNVFEKAKYNLTEKEEQLASLLAQPGYGMWLSGQSKLLSSQVVEFKGKKLPVPEAVGILAGLPIKDRHALSKEINSVLKKISHFAEAELNAAYTFKKIMDERRGFKKPYSATVLEHENDEKTVEGLVAMVTKSFHISKRFYKLHAKLLGEKKLSMSDRAVPIGKISKKFDFGSAVGLVKKGFAKIDQKYAKILEEFLANKQIDVYPRQGKRGGAYCWGSGTNPTFVLLNHTENINSVETLAHEMGHAFHTELSKAQGPLYSEYSTAVAEVASTFFEQVVAEELEKELSAEENITLLHSRLLGDMATIFRQIAFFNFEVELHKRIRSEGQISKEELAKLMNKHLISYLGEAFEAEEDDGYFFVQISHIRRFFYVYSYAYGQLISRALFENWKADHSYTGKIEKFLKAGGSMSPKDIFKSIGINTADPKFFEAGLKGIERDIDKLEKLSKTLQK